MLRASVAMIKPVIFESHIIIATYKRSFSLVEK